MIRSTSPIFMRVGLPVGIADRCPRAGTAYIARIQE
jgi:hypothetical protein